MTNFHDRLIEIAEIDQGGGYEWDERHALDLQKTQNEAKRKQARKRHDDYQEELLAIIRRRNEESLRLVEQIDELKRELYALRSA